MFNQLKKIKGASLKGMLAILGIILFMFIVILSFGFTDDVGGCGTGDDRNIAENEDGNPETEVGEDSDMDEDGEYQLKMLPQNASNGDEELMQKNPSEESIQINPKLGDTCDDTDNFSGDEGASTSNIYKKGQIKKKDKKGKWHTVPDTTDACVDSHILREWYCTFDLEKGIVAANVEVECEFHCEEGSQGGFCRPEICDEGDDGKDYTRASATQGINAEDQDFFGTPPNKYRYKTYYDSCSGKNLTEYYCTAKDLVEKKVHKCKYGCLGGRCSDKPKKTGSSGAGSSSNQPASSDYKIGECPFVSGIPNIPKEYAYSKGKELTLKADGSWQENWDYCKDANTLVEQTCKLDKTLTGIEIFCQYGCSDGACNYPPCYDPDPSPNNQTTVGNNEFSYTVTHRAATSGLKEGDAGGIDPVPGAQNYIDYCVGGSGLYEYICKNGKVEIAGLNCASGFGYPKYNSAIGSYEKGVCREGVCVIEPFKVGQ